MRESGSGGGYWSTGSSNFRGNDASRSYDRPNFNNENRPFPPPSSGGYGDGTTNYERPNPSYDRANQSYDRTNQTFDRNNATYDSRSNTSYDRPNPSFDGSNTSYERPNSSYERPNPPYERPNPSYDGNSFESQQRDSRYGGPRGMGPGPSNTNGSPLRSSGGGGRGGGSRGGGGGGDDGGGRMMGRMGPPPEMMGPPSGNMGMPSGGMVPPQISGGPPPPDADLFSSIRNLSQMNQNDIATKIISAVLSTGLVGNMSNQQGPPFSEPMSGFEERKPFPPRRSPPRSSRFGSSDYDRFPKERRGFRPSFSSSSYKPRIERQREVRERSTDVRKRLAYKRSWDEKPRDDHSKFKRQKFSDERRESKQDDGEDKDVNRSKSSSEKPSAEEQHPSADREKNAEKEKDADKKPSDEIPVEALYCHMCNHGNFSSEKTYLFHLEGVRHRKTAVAFHSKNDATLEYLRKNAKLASIRFGSLDNSVTPSKCSICYALVKENFYKHKKLLEHRLVKKFLMPKCCGRFFRTRHDMDEHRLSLPHLRKAYQSNQTKKFMMEESTAGENENLSNEDVILILKSKRNPEEAEDLSLDNIPPFDGNNMIGINYLEPKEAILCKPCQTLLPVGAKGLEGHLLSIDHFNSLVDHLRREGQNRKKSGEDSKDVKKRGEKDESDNESEADLEKELLGNSDDEKEKNTDDEGEDLPFIDENAHIVLEELDEEDEKPREEDSADENEYDNKLKEEESAEENYDDDDEEKAEEDVTLIED